MKKSLKGFSLIELIVVMAIMAIITLIAVPRYLNYTHEARNNQIAVDIKAAQSSTSIHMLKHNDELPAGSSKIDVAILNSYVAENRLYNVKSLMTSLNETETYSILPNVFIKRETGSKLKGQFIISSGGDVYYVDIIPGNSSVGNIGLINPSIELTETSNPDEMLATINYPIDSLIQEYKIDNGSWLPASFDAEKVKSQYIYTLNAKQPNLISHVIIPSNSAIYARAYFEGDIIKETTIDLSVDVINCVETSDSATVSLIYPEKAVTMKYRIGTGPWVTYKDDITLYENGVLQVRGIDSYGRIISYSELIVTNITITKSKISAYNNQTFFIKEDGSLWGWGNNGTGKLGIGNTTNQISPIKIMDKADQVAAGYDHTLVIKTDGSLWSFGSNSAGQLGIGSTTNRSIPFKVMDNVKQIAAGQNFSLAIKNDNSLWAWGANGYGQLGDGTTTQKLTPRKVMDDVKLVAASYYHSVAIKTDGSLWTWGDGFRGQLGDNSDKNRYTPMKIMDNVVQITASREHTLVVKEDGSLWSFGYNANGQLGDGTTVDKYVPKKILNNVKQAVAGDSHSLAIMKDGSMWAWGLNSSGQLGDGTATRRLKPVKIMSETARIVVAGSAHSVVIKDDGSIWSFGNNSYGQLGIGNLVNKSTPTQIALP